MDEDYCELMEMPASMCAHCRKTPSIEQEIARETEELRAKLTKSGQHWIPAQFGGSCGHCGTPFKPDTLIRPPRSPDFVWVAECCADV